MMSRGHRLSDTVFDRLVEATVASLPAEVRAALENMALTVEEEPDPAVLEDCGFDPDEEVLGLYVGVPLPERTYGEEPLLPDRIYVFRGPIRRLGRSAAGVKAELRVTIIHEVAHYLGFDEAALRERGWD